MGAVAAGALLFALLLLIVAVMLLQELRRTPVTEVVYVLEEVVPFVYRRLSDEALMHLDSDDVKRILEWEVYYLQGLARRSNGEGPPPIAGSELARDFILERTADEGRSYRPIDVDEVLAKEAEYLAEIGAVGPAAVEGGS